MRPIHSRARSHERMADGLLTLMVLSDSIICPAPLRRLPFQSIAHRCFAGRSGPFNPPRIFLTSRSLSLLNVQRHFSNSSHVRGRSV
jgi:hypothetical protein